MLEPTIPVKRWWHREDILLLILLAALFLLPGLHRIPLFDRDEPRFATAARNMVENHDYIVPTFNGLLRPDKPPLVYWLMDAAYFVTGGPAELGARLPSAICGTLTLIILYFMVGSRFGRLTGFIAALMYGSCALFLVESRLATADSTMILGIAGSMACAWQAWDSASATRGTMPRHDYLLDRSSAGGGSSGRSPMMIDQIPTAESGRMPLGMALLFWIALAWGTLAKGVPLVFVFVPMIVLSLSTGPVPAALKPLRFIHWNWSWWRQLRPLVGIPLLAILVGWWVILAGQATHWKLIEDMVGTHFMNRVGLPTPDMTPGGTQDAMKSYGKPPGFYFLTLWATFWPWSILLVPAAYHTVRRLRGKSALTIDVKPYQFLVAWIVPMWILLEVSRGKLMHYPLPLYMPLAILCADTLVQSWNRLTDVLHAGWFASARWVTLVIWVGMGGAVLCGASMAPDKELFWKCFPFGVALIATGAASAMTWGKPGWPYVLALCWGGSLMVANVMILPEMPELQVSRIAGTQMKELKAQDASIRLAVAGYEEATLVFYSGSEMPRFESAAQLLNVVPFRYAGWRGLWPSRSGPAGGTASDRWVIAVEEKVRLQLDAQHIAYTQLPRLARFDLPSNLQSYRISGFNTGNMKPVTVTVISNQPPHAPIATTQQRLPP